MAASRRNPEDARPCEAINLTEAQQKAAYGLMRWSLDYLYQLEYCFNCEPDKLADAVLRGSPQLITKLSMFVRDVTGSEYDENGNSFFF